MKKTEAQEKIGKRIREIREKKGLTMEELAVSIGKHKKAINRLEIGGVNPSMYLLYEIAGGLGVKLSTLLKGIQN